MFEEFNFFKLYIFIIEHDLVGKKYEAKVCTIKKR
jgi:hypothetical protein